MKKFFKGFFGFFAMALAFALVTGCERGRTDTKVIATVSGTDITYGEIKYDRSLIKAPEGTELTEDQINDIVFKNELTNLSNKIRSLIYTTKVKELGITVTDEEVNSNFESEVLLAGVTDESIAAIKNRKVTMFEALKEYAENPEKADIIYTNKLSLLFSKTEWDMYTSVYDEKQRLDKFAPDPNEPGSLEEMKKQRFEGIRGSIESYKFKKAVFPQIEIPEEDVKNFYDQMTAGKKDKVDFEKVQGAIPVFLMNMRFMEQCRGCYDEWLRSELNSDKVTIKDAEFRKFIKPENPEMK